MQMLHLPPVRDHHTHAGLSASLRGCLDLSELDRKEALASLKALPEDRLNTVHGWHSGKVPLAPADLENLPPILLINMSLHGFLLTPRAVARLEPVEPEILANRHDPLWCERNTPRLLGFYGRTARLEPDKFEAFMEGLEAQGIDRVDDLLLQSQNAWEVVQASRWADRVAFWTTPRIFDTHLSPEARATISGFKIFLDGALGAHTAALSEPFRDGKPGLLIYEDGPLRELLWDLQSRGIGVAIHAIGDRAIEQALGALESLARQGRTFPRVRLEHVQFITGTQARRARDLGLHLSMQPNFSEDSLSYQDRIAASACARNNPFRMLIDQAGFRPGADLFFGSDGMPYGLQAQLQWGLFPPVSGQALTLDELRAGLGAAPTGPTRAFRVDPGLRRVTALP